MRAWVVDSLSEDAVFSPSQFICSQNRTYITVWHKIVERGHARHICVLTVAGINIAKTVKITKLSKSFERLSSRVY